jgi:hypothetical protein
MKTISDITCDNCKENYNLKIPDICFKCFASSIELKQNQSFLAKSWEALKSKDLAWHALLYIPLTVFIGYWFGFITEIFWIVGGIYIQILPEIRNWCVKKF